MEKVLIKKKQIIKKIYKIDNKLNKIKNMSKKRFKAINQKIGKYLKN